jgi:hypothetical protein
MRGKQGSTFAAAPPPPRGKDVSSMKKPEKESDSKLHLKELKSRKRINLALSHLDRAEKLALDLLKICGDTTEKFAELTQIDEGARTSTGLLVVEKQEQIQQNGKDFRDKVKEIYNLIAPHVQLVKNYTKDVENMNMPSVSSSDAEETTSSVRTARSSGAPRNMYSSRLELRLASEKHSLLQDILSMEKKKKAVVSESDTEMTTRKVEGIEGIVDEPVAPLQESKKRKR